MTKMKFLAAAACLTLFFTACKKKDKDSVDYKAAIVGKWSQVEDVYATNVAGAPEMPSDKYTKGEYLRFTASDTLYTGDASTTPGYEHVEFYKVDGNILKFASNKAITTDVEVYTIEELTGTSLAYSYEDQVMGVKFRITSKLKK